MKQLSSLVRQLGKMVYGLIIGGPVDFIKLLIEFCRIAKRKKQLRDSGHIYTHCQTIPSKFYKRPDPLIYSQEYLMAQGLAVTWDNPDIQLYTVDLTTKTKLAPISSNDLKEGTEYLVEATVYNGSTEAPAVNMPVDFSFLSFGIGTQSTFISRTKVDLPVKGAPGHPAHTSALWRTPVTPGHYCLQVRLIWADDANPKNNMGQENTNVGIAHSPATFEFPVRNDSSIVEEITLETDSYTLAAPIDCNEVVNGRYIPKEISTRKTYSREALCKLLAARHRKGNHPLPPGWTVVVLPNYPILLQPYQQQLVVISAIPPDDFTGTQAINVNAYNRSHTLIGGVTLYIKR
jgi:hypothetical protein